MRFDALTGAWVAIVGDRQDRPNHPTTGCPFCVGGLEAPDPYTVRSFPNRWSPLVPGPAIDLSPSEVHDPFAHRPARGAAEVVLYTPEHVGSLATIGEAAVRDVVDLWAARTEALLARAEVEYVLVFENRGAEVGATISHPHGQIYGFPTVPPLPSREAEVAFGRGCPLCSVVPAEVERGARVVFDGGDWVTHVPFAAGHPFATTVAPRRHVPDLASLDDPGRDGLAAALVDIVGRYDRIYETPLPYLMWIHPGVHLHVHFAPPHRAPGVLRYVASAEVGTEMLSNPVAPEIAAELLRRA
ncbi:MAG: galactose-1-phosphate uridylyltransferase [Acidimicrobiia bacterium]